VGLYHRAKFGRNRSSSFDNMHVFQFREFGLKTPIHAPKIGVLGDLTPKWGRGKVGIRRDHPRRRIEMKFCMVGRWS